MMSGNIKTKHELQEILNVIENEKIISVRELHEKLKINYYRLLLILQDLERKRLVKIINVGKRKIVISRSFVQELTSFLKIKNNDEAHHFRPNPDGGD